MRDFNWVEARSECSIAKLFELLESAINRDVETANRVRSSPLSKFSSTRQTNHITVIREQAASAASVRFCLQNGQISAAKEDGKKIIATPSLNQAGDCVLIVAHAETEIWQFCRAALESLFFPC